MSVSPSQNAMSVDDLRSLFDAFNRHDLQAVMKLFAEDCVFDAVAGDEVHGTRAVGAKAVAEAFEKTFAAMPDAHWDHHGHFVQGDRAVSEWTFTATIADGSRIEAQGADIFTLRNGLVVHKQAFRKQRPPLPAK